MRVSPRLSLLLAAMSLLIPAAASAEPPAAIETMLRQLGRVVEPPTTAMIYLPLQQKEPYEGFKIERDIAYGSAELNKLDVFTPDGAGGPRPVLLFVRGGAFMTGDKHAVGVPFYDNVMLWAASQGMVGVNINYRLAPDAVWPAGAEDVAAAVRWVKANISSRGGDPARIILMGHSAGGVHVVNYLSHPEMQAPDGAGVAAAIAISADYDLTSMKLTEPENIYFGTDRGTYAARSSLAGLLKSSLPLMLVRAELDPPVFEQQFNQAKAALCSSRHGCARTLVLSGESHMSEVYSINTEDTQLTDAIADFVKTGK